MWKNQVFYQSNKFFFQNSSNQLTCIFCHDDTTALFNQKEMQVLGPSFLFLNWYDSLYLPDCNLETVAFDAEFLCPSRPGLPRDPDFFHRANEQNLFLLTPFFDERRYSSGPMYLDPYLANCVKSHIAQIKQHLSSPLPTDSQNFARSAYLALLGLLILLAEPEKGGIASPGYGVAEEMVNYIRQHYADPSLNTEQIAKHFARHRSAIYTAFEFATGFSIKEFLDRYRVFAGKKLLAFTRLPVAEVAIQVGCSNENTFIATFKRVCGTTPGNFRKKLRRQNPAAR